MDQPAHTRTDSARLDILLADYEQARDEERHYTAQQTTITAITLTAVTVAAAIGFHSSTNSEIVIPGAWHDPVLFVTPLLAVVPLLFLVQIGTTAVWRSFYIRALEREIRSVLVTTELSSYPALPVMSYGELYVSESAGRGPGSPGVIKVLVGVAYPVVITVVGGLALSMAFQVKSLPLQLLMFLVYGGGGFALIVYIARVHIFGRDLLAQNLEILQYRSNSGLVPSPTVGIRQRSIWSYFVLPRPDELLTKSPFLIAGVLLAFAQSPRPSAVAIDWINLGLLWLAIEFLIYQARYQWNDILGLHEDKEGASTGRGRLPDFPRNRLISWIVVLLRIYLALVVATVSLGDGSWGIHLNPAVVLGLAGVFGAAILYELWRWRLRAKGGCSGLDLGVLCVLVGLGYAVRFLVGYVAVGGPPGPGWLGALVAWAIGIFFVSLTWLIEASWNVDWVRTKREKERDILKPAAIAHDASNSKPYLAELLRRTGMAVGSLPARRNRRGVSADVVRGDFRLRDATRLPFVPLRVSGLIWFLAIGTGGTYLLHLPIHNEWLLVSAGVAAAIIAAVPTNGVLQRWFFGLASVPILACYPTAMAIEGRGGALVWVELAVVIVLALTPFALYSAFSGMTYPKSREFAKKLGFQLTRFGFFVYDFASGADPRFRWRTRGSEQTS